MVLLTYSYRDQEFVRVAYFINNECNDQELRKKTTSKPLFHQITRNILASKRRVTRFKINLDDTLANVVPSNGMEEDGVDMENGATNDGQTDEASSTRAEGLMAGMVAPDENSMAFPREFNENFISLAMECWKRSTAASIIELKDYICMYFRFPFEFEEEHADYKTQIYTVL